MKLHAVTLYRPGEDPCEARIHRHVASKLVALFEASQLTGRNGWSAVATVVDVGDPKKALLALANDPNWLQDRPRIVVK